MKVCKGYINSIYSGSAVDGVGIRVVVFFSGCNLTCKFCHNPETLFTSGQEIAVDEVVDKVLRYKVYLKKGGVTLSGGEPFLQKDFALVLIEKLKDYGVNTAIETNGHIADEELINASEYLIVDVKNQEKKDLAVYRDFLSVCQRQKKSVELTSVIVKGENDGAEDVDCLRRLKAEFPCVFKIRLLPFHKLCEEKYKKLNKEFLYKDRLEPTKEDMQRLQKMIDE